MNNIKNNMPVWAIFYCLLALVIWTEDVAVASTFSIDMDGEKAALDIKEMPPAELVERIRSEAGVEIRGLVERHSGQVTFSHTGRSMDDVLRQLLRYLGETNFIYQYEDDRLIRITVLPTGDDESPASQQGSGGIDLSPKTTVVEIVGILEESQAESVGLKKGDYIYQYGGRRMFDAQTLVKETDSEGDSPTVEMIVIRDGGIRRFFFDRGFIGIQVRTRILRQDELPDTIDEL